ERDGDHAGRLIASIVIDLAAKSSAKFKYTYEMRTIRRSRTSFSVYRVLSRCVDRWHVFLSILYHQRSPNSAYKVRIECRVRATAHMVRVGSLSKFLGNFVSRDFVVCHSAHCEPFCFFPCNYTFFFSPFSLLRGVLIEYQRRNITCNTMDG
ncbi:hypothetical protein WH47_10957, partial [Habropoda laboriosa]